MPDFELSRRSLLASTTALLASTAMPGLLVAQEAKQGGRLVVAADSEPKNLNPAIVASNGVFFISSKIIKVRSSHHEVARRHGNKYHPDGVGKPAFPIEFKQSRSLNGERRSAKL